MDLRLSEEPDHDAEGCCRSIMFEAVHTRGDFVRALRP